MQGGGRGRPHQEKDGRAGQGRQGLQKVESYDDQNFSIAKSPLKMPIERLGSEENNFFKSKLNKKNIDIRYSQETKVASEDY